MRQREQPMVSLLYHDVVSDAGEIGGAQLELTGFTTPGAEIYKLSTSAFSEHLRTVRAAGHGATTVHGYLASPQDSLSVSLTFDDGGVSAHSVIAPLLEELGWRGHFFIATDFIDTPGFLSAEQLVDLNRRGHVIGSHSCSHPERMSKLSGEELRYEWSHSCRVLAEILGERVTVASVPNGYSSPAVIEAADAAGIEWLFTSEPTSSPTLHGRCRVLGRYSVQAHTTAKAVADLVASRSIGRSYQAALWSAKKMVKAAAGEGYLAVRAALLRSRSS